MTRLVVREQHFSGLKYGEAHLEVDGICFDILKLSPEGFVPFENVVVTIDKEMSALHISRLDLTDEHGKLEMISDISRLSRIDPDFFHTVKWRLRTINHPVARNALSLLCP